MARYDDDNPAPAPRYARLTCGLLRSPMTDPPQIHERIKSIDHVMFNRGDYRTWYWNELVRPIIETPCMPMIHRRVVTKERSK